jgi:hypothetical protein
VSDRTSKGTFAKGNTAARQHGAYGFLALGRMPKGCRTYRNLVGRLRRFLYGQLPHDKDGLIAPDKEALVNTACEQEGRRLLLLRHLAKKGDELTTDQFLRLQADAADALEARDRCLRQLLAPAPGPADPLSALRNALAARQGDAQPQAGPAAASPSASASAGRVGDPRPAQRSVQEALDKAFGPAPKPDAPAGPLAAWADVGFGAAEDLGDK